MNSYWMSLICAAQYSLGISCEQFWQRLPPNCSDRWPEWAASVVLYACRELQDMDAVPSASKSVAALQKKIVACYAYKWGADGVGDAALVFLRQRLSGGYVALQAAVRTAATMNAQEVASTLLAFANMGERLGEAQQPMMRAVVRVSDRMSAQGVANTLWSFVIIGSQLAEAQDPLMGAIVRTSESMNAQQVASTLWVLSSLALQPSIAHECLLSRVPIVASDFNAIGLSQMQCSLAWLEEDGYYDECMEDTVQSIGGWP
jgi:hypothetical protein